MKSMILHTIQHENLIYIVEHGKQQYLNKTPESKQQEKQVARPKTKIIQAQS